jgi:ATP-dependent helicase/nuclease subunit A
VALTRARDRLILCGRIPATRGADPTSWRKVLEAAYERPEIAGDTRRLRVGEREILRFGPDPARVGPAEALPQQASSSPGSSGGPRVTSTTVGGPPLGRPDEPGDDGGRVGDTSAKPAGSPHERAPLGTLPAWTGQALRAETGGRWASPSSIADFAADSAPSPLAAQGGLGRFRRGELIHRLFEILPDLPAEGRAEAARRLLGREPDLDESQIEEMTAACLAVLDDPRFSAVFGPGSRAEAALAGASPELPPGLKVSGRMDRLVVAPERVLVVDYKTNRPAPDRVQDVDPAYLAQMAAYVAVLRQLYPDRRVQAALVWTDGPKLTVLPDEVIAQTLRRLREGG